MRDRRVRGVLAGLSGCAVLLWVGRVIDGCVGGQRGQFCWIC